MKYFKFDNSSFHEDQSDNGCHILASFSSQQATQRVQMTNFIEPLLLATQLQLFQTCLTSSRVHPGESIVWEWDNLSKPILGVHNPVKYAENGDKPNQQQYFCVYTSTCFNICWEMIVKVNWLVKSTDHQSTINCSSFAICNVNATKALIIRNNSWFLFNHLLNNQKNKNNKKLQKHQKRKWCKLTQI